jgi:hypothetical protein
MEVPDIGEPLELRRDVGQPVKLGGGQEPLGPVRVDPNVSVPFRSVRESGRRGVGELLNRGCDPAPGIGAVVITISSELVDTGAALLECLVAVIALRVCLRELL